ncbi:MAG: hypothetical protein RLZZ76_233 [Candidatus Parcubacteria bacterium]|jgi:hypothetical protein
MHRFQALFVFIAVACTPLFALAYESVIAKPADARVVLPIADATVSREFFGRLNDFPHTYEFEVKETIPYKAQVFVQDDILQKNDVSIIIVKAERRGVSEVGRTKAKEVSWESVKDRKFVESFRNGGALEGTLEPGWYKLEVSAPNNDAVYRLVWGTQKVKHGYFGSVRALFEVKAFLKHSRFGALLSPLLYIPLFIILGVSGFVYYRKRKQALS